MPYLVRQALPEDAVSIALLVHVLGYATAPAAIIERIEAYLDRHSRVFVALSGEHVIGFLSFHAIPLFHEPAMLGRITALAINPDHHRQGVGSALVRAAECFAISVGCLRIEVISGDSRELDAHIFYTAVGYHSDCRRFLKHLVL